MADLDYLGNNKLQGAMSAGAMLHLEASIMTKWTSSASFRLCKADALISVQLNASQFSRTCLNC